MANIINLQGVALADSMIKQALALNPNVFNRLTQEDITMAYQSELDTQILSIRMNRNLVADIDQYTREQALKRKERITRNGMIVELAEVALSSLRRLEALHAEQPGLDGE